MRSVSILVAVALAVVIVALNPNAAFAHERRAVGGKYQLVVGFLDEPAVQGEMNGASLRVTNTQTEQPVEGLDKTLKLQVIQGSATRDMAWSPVFGQAGSYAAHFIPTRAGSYKFHISGTIEGTSVDELFESGPGRFNDVESAADLQFPDKVGDVGSIADLQRTVGTAGTTARTAIDQANDAAAAASSARTFGIAGIVVGIAGLVVAGVALGTRRRV